MTAHLQPFLPIYQTVPALRVGVLVPSSSKALEPATSFLAAPLADTIVVHFSRSRVSRIAHDAASDAQFSMGPNLTAAELLADAKASVIAWNGTAASWRGFDTDADLCKAIGARTGCPATSTVVGRNSALQGCGARRLVLLTPYTADFEAAIIRNYAGIGI